MAQQSKLVVFAHLDEEFAPAGNLNLIEENTTVIASEFAYGLIYLDRPNAIEVDPVSLSISDRRSVKKKKILPSGGLKMFGGIRDAAPDAWGRRVIEAKLKVPVNSLPESTYLLEAGSNRIGALDIRANIHAPARHSRQSITDLQYLMEAAERIEEGSDIPAKLEAIFDVGSALGGARPKATVRDDDGNGTLPVPGSRPGRAPCHDRQRDERPENVQPFGRRRCIDHRPDLGKSA